jgi:hypothetical protein
MIIGIYREIILNWILKTCDLVDWIQVECVGEKRNAYSVLVGKPEGMRPPGTHRHR